MSCSFGGIKEVSEETNRVAVEVLVLLARRDVLTFNFTNLSWYEVIIEEVGTRVLLEKFLISL